MGAAMLMALLLSAAAPAPSELSPVTWSPDPVDSRFAGEPKPLTILATLAARGPEACARRADGVLACGTEDGKILLVAADLSRVIGVLADTGGRPFGMKFDAAGRLLVCDGRKGLLSVAPDGAITVLRGAPPHGDFVFSDDVDIADGVLWMSDASTRNGPGRVAEEFMERRPSGLLYKLDPKGQGEVVLRDLAFANGVGVSREGDYVLVNETARMRVRRLWLKGPNAGSSDFFATGLPGNPDNLTIDARGRVWIALVTPRDPTTEALAARPEERLRRFREAAGRPPPAFVLRQSRILVMDRDGRLLGDFAVPLPDLGNVTSVLPTPAGLVLGTNRGSRLALAAWPESLR